MNQSFLERLKSDRTLQLIFAGGFLSFVLIIVLILGSLGGGGQKKEVLPCYNTTLTIWAPFEEYKILNFFQGFSNRCVRFEYKEKSLEEILKVLPRIMVQKEVPDIVFVDRFHLLEYKDVFEKAPKDLILKLKPVLHEKELRWFEPWLGFPMFVDSLVPIYLQSYLRSAGFINPPETFGELNQFIKKLRVVDQAGNLIFSPIVFGGLKEKRLVETILALSLLKMKNIDREELRNTLPSMIDFYLSYSNPQNENYSYFIEWPDGKKSLLQRKSGAFIGFYEDFISLKNEDPRINVEVGKFYRFDHDPKRANFTQVYYFGVLKTKNAKAAWDFLNWLYAKQLMQISQEFNLVPADVEKVKGLEKEKRIVLEEALVGETFDFVNLDVLRDNIKMILEAWIKDPVDGERLLDNLEPAFLPYIPEWLEQ